MIYECQILGGVVDGGQAWFNNFTDSLFHEVGSVPNQPQTLFWRVSFTPVVAQKYEVRAHLKHRMGNGSFKNRLYMKCRIVRIAPTYKNDFTLYSEAMWEGGYDAGNVAWAFDAPVTPFIVDDIANIGVQHTYAVEHLAGDGVQGQIGYGSPLIIRD